MLFSARILDGLTGGNVSVAQAMVSDTATPQNRAKKFGIIGSAFGFGFVIGPAIGGLLNKFGPQVPFFFAAGIQTFTVDVLKLQPHEIGLFYAGFGITGILMQLAVPLIKKVISSQALILLLSTVCCLGMMILAGFATGMALFAVSIGIYGLFNGLRNPMLNAIIADHNNDSEKGEVMGINQSYASIGQTLGPVTAGLVTVISVHSVFFLSSLYILIAFLFSIRLKSRE
jgi:MFS family permease